MTLENTTGNRSKITATNCSKKIKKSNWLHGEQGAIFFLSNFWRKRLSIYRKKNERIISWVYINNVQKYHAANLSHVSWFSRIFYVFLSSSPAKFVRLKLLLKITTVGYIAVTSNVTTNLFLILNLIKPENLIKIK